MLFFVVFALFTSIPLKYSRPALFVLKPKRCPPFCHCFCVCIEQIIYNLYKNGGKIKSSSTWRWFAVKLPFRCTLVHHFSFRLVVFFIRRRSERVVMCVQCSLHSAHAPLFTVTELWLDRTFALSKVHHRHGDVGWTGERRTDATNAMARFACARLCMLDNAKFGRIR